MLRIQCPANEALSELKQTDMYILVSLYLSNTYWHSSASELRDLQGSKLLTEQFQIQIIHLFVTSELGGSRAINFTLKIFSFVESATGEVRMKRNNFRQVVLLVFLFGLVSVPLSLFSMVQEQKKDEKEPEAVDIEDASKDANKAVPDVGYTKEEYDEFQKALGNPDLKLRAEGLSQFIKTHPKSKLNEHAMGAFPPMLKQLYEQKDMASLGVVAEEFLQMKPDDVLAIGSAMESFHSTKDYTKAVKYGESYYAKQPSAQVAQLLAHSYGELKNDAKFAAYAEKCIPEMTPKDAFPYSARLSYYYAERKDIPRSAQHCQKMMAAFGEGETPPGYTSERWTQEKARAYSIIGRNHYDKKQFGNAVAAYNNSLKYYRQNDEAYYYLGMCYWNANDTMTALKSFAKAYNLNKPYSKTARSSMETLYKQLHNGSLEGIDAVLRAASAEMK
jgi:tetratricopeptide (TPR) repeat protein